MKEHSISANYPEGWAVDPFGEYLKVQSKLALCMQFADFLCNSPDPIGDDLMREAIRGQQRLLEEIWEFLSAVDGEKLSFNQVRLENGERIKIC